MVTDLQQLIENAYDQSSELARWLGPMRDEAYDRWLAETGEAAEFLVRTLRLNEGKPLQQILRRPDVQAALRTPFLEAAGVTEDRIKDAWNRGRDQGIDEGRRELQDSGIRNPVSRPAIPTEIRTRLIEDARRNGRDAARQFREALNDPDPAASLNRVARSHANRASLGVDTSGRYSHSAGKEGAYRLAAQLTGKTVGKIWVTSFSATTCPMCASLHGTRRGLGEPFPIDRSFSGRVLRSYGALNHPPRHPNCRCRVVLFLPAFEGSPLQQMTGFARRWWREHRP